MLAPDTAVLRGQNMESGKSTGAAAKMLSLDAAGGESIFHASFSLVRGVYELRVIAPFNTQVAVDVLNPVIGFELQGDRDPDPHSYNSKVVNPQDGTYTFEIRLDKPVSGNELTVRCNLLSHEVPGPQPAPPQPPQPPAPPPPPPPPSPDAVNQQRYRDLGFEISGDGGVVFYWVALVRNKKTGEMYVSASYAIAYSNNVHDPERLLQNDFYARDHIKYPPTGDFELISRTEPLASVGAARRTAEAYSTRYYGVPDQYGMVAPGIIKRGRNGNFFP
jgi:hypothetical protein